MAKRVLITSALPYANGQLHFGHIAGAYLPADCYARFQRLQGSDVLYICGSDEYGVAITLSAELAGRTPKAQVDHFHAVNKDLFQKLHFSFDHFSRTTWPGHVATVQQFFLDLLKNGHIEEKVTEQLYSPQDSRFLADRYVVGTCPKCGFENARGDECTRCGSNYEATDLKNPRSKLTNAPLVLKETKHWFLLFDHFKDQLSKWLGEKPWKPNVLNFAKSYVADLKPRAITRDGEWGVPIPLPNTEGKVLYVWFDAPIGYISATKEWAELKGSPDAWKPFWQDPETTYVQFIGKDNIPFHAVFFPAMVMGQNQPYNLVHHLPANEFLNLEGRQFSKSEGWTIDLTDFFSQFTADQIRYTLAANAPENQDSEFTWRDFQNRCNSELLGKYGNLANRLLVFIQNQCAGQMPSHAPDSAFLKQLHSKVEEARAAYEHFHLRKAAALLMEIAQLGNVYFDTHKPWSLAKAPETRPQMEKVLSTCLECLKCLALVSLPIIPHAAQKLWQMIGETSQLSEQNWDEVIQNNLLQKTLPKPEVLFKRVEDSQIVAQEEKLKGLVK
ncbi:MAG: methionine--tRNA ligase [Rhabdochlamydiaceae bacterium]|nr:methionine--tRNA ligase [Rhabdochlamydiaceae bacterium]